MNSNITERATAFLLAALVSLGVLAGLNGLAASELATAQSQLARSAAVDPV